MPDKKDIYDYNERWMTGQYAEALIAVITTETVTDYLSPIENAVIADFGGESLTEVLKLGRRDLKPFISTNERTQKFLRENFGKNMKEITDTTKKEIGKAFAEGVELGENYNDMTRRLNDEFKHMSRARKRTIARTEVGSAASHATHEGYKQSGLVSTRRWVTTFLNSRQHHKTLSGREVAMNEPFTVAGYSGMYPGDFNAASMDINCRCREVVAKFLDKEITEDTGFHPPEEVEINWRSSLHGGQVINKLGLDWKDQPAGYDPGEYSTATGASVRQKLVEFEKQGNEKIAAYEKQQLPKIEELDRMQIEMIDDKWELLDDQINSLDPAGFSSQSAYDAVIEKMRNEKDKLLILGEKIHIEKQELFDEMIIFKNKVWDEMAEEMAVIVKPKKGKKLNAGNVSFKGRRMPKAAKKWLSDEAADVMSYVSEDVEMVGTRTITPLMESARFVEIQKGSKKPQIFAGDFVALDDKIDLHMMGPTKRAFYRAHTRHVHTTDNALDQRDRTLSHEIGHQLEYDVRDEYGNAVWQEKANRFLKDRSMGEQPVRLKDLYPNSNYDVDEITYVDKWNQLSGHERVAGEYSGKVYDKYPGKWGGNGLPATEIISMGIQRLILSPIDFAKNDPEYFDFIVSLLHGD